MKHGFSTFNPRLSMQRLLNGVSFSFSWLFALKTDWKQVFHLKKEKKLLISECGWICLYFFHSIFTLSMRIKLNEMEILKDSYFYRSSLMRWQALAVRSKPNKKKDREQAKPFSDRWNDVVLLCMDLNKTF